MSLVYKATNTVTGQTYIGMTSGTLSRRMAGHRCSARKNVPVTKFAQAIKNYGFESFEFTVLVDGLTDDEAVKEEIRLIEEMDPDYNHTLGGPGPCGYKWTIERYRRNAEIPRTPEWRRRISEGLRGRKPSSTAIENMRKSSKAKLHKPVMCLSDGRWFPSIRHASDHYGISQRQISVVCSGAEATAGGKYFVRSSTALLEDECQWLIREIDRRVAKNLENRAQARSRPVICLTDGVAHPSVAAAARHYGLQDMTVIQSCQRATRLTTGLSFMYADAPEPPVWKEKTLEEIAAANRKRDEALQRGLEKNRKRVKCLEDGRIFPSISHAAREYNIAVALLSAAIHRNGRAKKMRFAFVEGAAP